MKSQICLKWLYTYKQIIEEKIRKSEVERVFGRIRGNNKKSFYYGKGKAPGVLLVKQGLEMGIKAGISFVMVGHIKGVLMQ